MPVADTNNKVMRSAFIPALEKVFREHEECIFITADDGAPELDTFYQTMPERFVQVGIAEQQMIGMAAGMAKEGMRPYCYAILTFLSSRVHEFVKLDIAAMKLPVTLFGVGTGYSYSQMGATHHLVEDIALMASCPGLEIWSPSDPMTAAAMAQLSYETPIPKYIRLDRDPLPDLQGSLDGALQSGIRKVTTGPCDVLIVTTGIMTHQAMKVAAALAGEIGVGVLDVLRIAPFPADELKYYMRRYSRPVVTLEEHFLHGGLGSIVASVITDGPMSRDLLRIGVPEKYTFESGGRQTIWRNYGLDVDSLVSRIRDWL